MSQPGLEFELDQWIPVSQATEGASSGTTEDVGKPPGVSPETAPSLGQGMLCPATPIRGAGEGPLDQSLSGWM